MWCFFVVGSLRGAAVGSEWSLRSVAVRLPCAGAVYKGPYPFAEARATILKFALPVLRQGDLPLLGELRFTLEHLLARSGGLARLALFACKKRDSPERTQAGAVDRAWRDLRDGALGIRECEGRQSGSPRSLSERG